MLLEMFFFNPNRNIYSSCHLKSKDLRGVKQQTRFKPNTPPQTKKTHTKKKRVRRRSPGPIGCIGNSAQT